MAITITSLEEQLSFTLDSWTTHPQRPKWKNESIIRLGSSAASTQITNKRSDLQSSQSYKYFSDFASLDTFLDSFLEITRKGRFRWDGHNNEQIVGLIFSDINYNWMKGSYSFGGICYDYILSITFEYIVDEVATSGIDLSDI